MSQLSPKGKSMELIERYKHYFPSMLHKEKINPDVKACALICVNEILEQIEIINAGEVPTLMIFWRQVKTEIQNL